jgi:iron complex outermembrane recepter protein
MLKPGSRFSGAMLVVTGLCLADARLALAQDQASEGIQEVVVTAERRVENLQTTPIAITALSSETLQKDGVNTFAGVAEQSPSINFTPYPSSSNTLILYMRGQGVADANQITQDGSVGLYEDGFYISRPQAETFDLADPERVEILRGPQGTLYGRNTTGGAVNIISKKPTGEFGGDFSVDAGQRNYVRTLGSLNLPTVFGGLSSKVTVLYSNLAGNVHNTPDGGLDFNRQNQEGLRAALRWDNGGPFTADYFYEVGEIKSTPIYYQDSALAGVIPGYPSTVGLTTTSWQGYPITPSDARFNSDGLTLAFKINPSTQVRSLTYYRGLDSRFFQDYAGGFSDPATAGIVGVTNFTSSDVVQSNEFTQELQLIGNIGPKLNYVAGLYYFDEHANHAEAGTIDIPQEFIPGIPVYSSVTQRYVTADAKSKAAYFQATYQITQPLSITLGGRYTKDTRDATRTYTSNSLAFVNPPIPGCAFVTGSPFQCPIDLADPVPSANSLSFSKFNPAGTIAYQFTPDINTYLRIATGYKAGGSSEAANFGQFGQTFAPEDVTTYELGLKSYWFEHRLRANVAVFYSDFSNMQLQFNTVPGNLAIVQSYNAGKATVQGAEFEFLYAPINDLTLGVSDTVLSTDMKTVYALPGTIFDPATNPYSPYQVGQNVAPLFRVPYAPNNVLVSTLDWTMFRVPDAGNLELYLDFRYQGRQYDTAPTGVDVPGSARYYSIPAYGLLNGRVIWNVDTHNSKNSLKFSIWAKNLTNKQYQEHTIGQGSAPIVAVPNSTTGAEVPQTGYTYNATAWAPERQVGAQLFYSF